MHNLLDNANKFTRSGVIRIEAERINTHKSGHTLEFRVLTQGSASMRNFWIASLMILKA